MIIRWTRKYFKSIQNIIHGLSLNTFRRTILFNFYLFHFKVYCPKSVFNVFNSILRWQFNWNCKIKINFSLLNECQLFFNSNLLNYYHFQGRDQNILERIVDIFVETFFFQIHFSTFPSSFFIQNFFHFFSSHFKLSSSSSSSTIENHNRILFHELIIFRLELMAYCSNGNKIVKIKVKVKCVLWLEYLFIFYWFAFFICCSPSSRHSGW